MNTLAPSLLIGYFFIAGNEDMHERLDDSNFGKFATELQPLIDVRI